MMLKRVLLFKLVLMACAAIPVASQAPVQVPPSNPNATSAEQQADKLFLARNWSDAAKAYEAITKTSPKDGRAWLQLGASLHELGSYAQAAEAHHTAETLGYQPAFLTMFRQVRAYARLGNADKAFEVLNRAVTAGFLNVQAIETHPDLASLRSDPRFPAIVAQAKRNADPCNNNPSYRQLDFWIGAWEVQSTGTPQGTPGHAVNVIEKVLGGCALWENWQPTQTFGHGKGLHVFNAALGKWEQHWVTASGNVVNFYGELKNGKMEYTTESTLPNGTKMTRITRIYAIDKDTVRQYSDQTTDGGKTWTPAFDLTYYRKTN